MALPLLSRTRMQSAGTQSQFNLRSITGPVLLHLLSREMLLPRVFLWRCAATLGAFKERIEPRFPKELVELTALPLWVYINLKAKLGAPRAFEIMRVAVLTGGIAQWNLAYATVDRKRTFAALCDQELEVNRAGPTRWNTLEVVARTENRFELKVTRCLYHELAQSLGVREITPIVCQIDNAGFNSYLPDEVISPRIRLPISSYLDFREMVDPEPPAHELEAKIVDAYRHDPEFDRSYPLSAILSLLDTPPPAPLSALAIPTMFIVPTRGVIPDYERDLFARLPAIEKELVEVGGSVFWMVSHPRAAADVICGWFKRTLPDARSRGSG